MEKVEIVTERFLLRELEEWDVTERYLDWLQDGEARKYINAAAGTKRLADLRQYVLARVGKPDVLFLGIFEKYGRLHVGNIKYEPMNSELGYAIMGILIGDPAYRGKGVAAEVLVASARWLKENRNIKRILLGVSRDNRAAIRSYEKVGFVAGDSEFMPRKSGNSLTMVLDLENLFAPPFNDAHA